MAKETRMASSSDDDSKVKGPLSPGQRWSVQRKREVALRILRGDRLMAALALVLEEHQESTEMLGNT